MAWIPLKWFQEVRQGHPTHHQKGPLKGNNTENRENNKRQPQLCYFSGRWVALDSFELIVFDSGVVLDTSATQCENFVPPIRYSCDLRSRDLSQY